MDIVSKEKRHDIMSKVRRDNTKPEILVRKYLFSKGFRYRKNDKRFAGKPDIVLPKYKTMVFINGCFWHQHTGCKSAVLPQENREYWVKKLQRNVDRDKQIEKKLTEMGWNIIVIWECELSTIRKREQRLDRLIEEIKQNNLYSSQT